MEYKIICSGRNPETKINELAKEGWRAINLVADRDGFTVLLVRSVAAS